MDIKQIQKPLTQFVANIPPSLKVDKVLVFGSYSKGTATKDSDIDVVVASEDFEKIDHFDRIKILDTAAGDIKPEVQAWGFTNQELESFDELTTAGQARTSGIRFV